MRSISKNTPVPDNAKTPQVFPPTNGAAPKVNGKVSHDQIELPDGSKSTTRYIKRGDHIAPYLTNACLMLREKWPGVLAYDVFRHRVTLVKSPPDNFTKPWTGCKPGEEWTDHDDRLATIWLQDHDLYLQDAADAIDVVAHDQPIHPIRDYLNGVKWDGMPRLDFWLSLYFNADPTAYTEAAGRCWLVAAVARIMEPGCKADHCLILEGRQGARKSTGLEALFGDEWFIDKIHKNLEDRDAPIDMEGKWCIELGELTVLNSAKVSALKGFLSRRRDRYRSINGKRSEDHKRQCVFAGTINPEIVDDRGRGAGYLTDWTGNRRHLPIVCGDVDIEGIKRDRDVLWAEAYEYYKTKHVWHFDPDMEKVAEEEQAARLQTDDWQPTIENFLETNHRKAIEVEELLRVLGKSADSSKGDENGNRVKRILRRMGWHLEKIKARGLKRDKYHYVCPENPR